ncbi:MAG: DUF6305 family protein [Clostridiales bacterium]|nr:DUF6305 family protein [Clostridiales bacterium]MCI2160984.1 DUF6305 family protein [Oscillospiraceae bacterium]MCI1961699.1 DUF6305 family protein [Clostridiales bacterium]MCI2021892.1 DUF6305 family protein [Clostridiales bacterium]MCI2026093.1 DUF6305 family protein [Clostridiales bacterium]
MAALMMVVSMAACGESGGTSSAAQSAAHSTASSAASGAASTSVQGLKQPIAEQPILLTSVGQSADVEMVKTLFKKINIDPTTDHLATADSIGNAKTLVLAIGGSSKGLGAAGIDADQELARVAKLVDAAKAKGLTIIAMHTGGQTRRGELSDKFIKPAFEKADYAIVVAEGDKDGMMKGLAASESIPMDTVDKITDVPEVLKAAFK